MSSLSTFLVRPATLRDAKAIAELHANAAQTAFKGLLPEQPASEVPLEQRYAFWREAIEYSEPQVQVALDDGRLVGFVGFDRSRDAGTPPTTGEIWAMYVNPVHWGRGAGLALWDAARDGLVEEGCSKATLWLALGNQRALRFFELAGFKRELASARTVPMGSTRIEEIRLKRALT